MTHRNDIKGFTWKIFSFYIEIVYIKNFWNIRTIAINKGINGNTDYLIDR